MIADILHTERTCSSGDYCIIPRNTRKIIIGFSLNFEDFAARWKAKGGEKSSRKFCRSICAEQLDASRCAARLRIRGSMCKTGNAWIYTTSATIYTNFTTEERKSLVRHQVAELKQSMILRLKHSRSSISRELHRDGEADGRYSGFSAEEKYRQCWQRCVHKRLPDDPKRNKLVTEKLREYWLSEQIAGWLKVSGSELRVSSSNVPYTRDSWRFQRSVCAVRVARRPRTMRRRGVPA